jgi:hypothetical protein
MKKDKCFAKNLIAILNAPDSAELIRTTPFLEYLKFESRKRKLDPSLFFTHPEKFIRAIKKKH